jgi:dTDP-4-dehydrorhamnose reductase
MKKKILITGGSGLLGSTLIRTASDDFDIHATYHTTMLVPDVENCTFHYLEVRNKKMVDDLVLKVNPDIIIHTIAKSSPDYCEQNQDESWDVNVNGTKHMLNAAKKVGAYFTWMSSNQVFSGKNPPYFEDSQKDPVNFYGKTKVRSEEDVLKENYNASTIRLMTMYGWGNPEGQKNSAMWVIEMMKQKKEIKVVNDVFNNFLWVYDAARFIWKVIELKEKPSLIQIAGGETANRYEFAKKVATIFEFDSGLISPVPKSYFEDEAPRPLNTIYNISKLKKLLNVEPVKLAEGLSEMKNVLQNVTWKTLKNEK